MLPWYHFALAASCPVHETSLMLAAELCPLQTHRLTGLTGTLLGLHCLEGLDRQENAMQWAW